MKSAIFAAVIVLLACSTAFGGWGYAIPVVVPSPVVHAYWPVGPVYTYVPTVVTAPVVAVPPRIVYRASRFARVPLWHAPVVTVRSKVYYRGRPVRNTVRAVFPY